MFRLDSEGGGERTTADFILENCMSGHNLCVIALMVVIGEKVWFARMSQLTVQFAVRKQAARSIMSALCAEH